MRLQRVTIFVFLLVCISSQTYSQRFLTATGAELFISIKPQKEVVLFGETTYIILTIENRSNVTLFFPDGGDYRNNLGRPDSYSVSVKCLDSKTVIQPEVTFSMGGLIGSQTIPAGGVYKTKLWLPHWAAIDRPGKYFVN